MSARPGRLVIVAIHALVAGAGRSNGVEGRIMNDQGFGCFGLLMPSVNGIYGGSLA